MVYMVDRLANSQHEIYDYQLSRLQIACLDNINCLKKIGEGMSIEDAIRLSYTNPSFETQLNKNKQAIEYIQTVNTHCELLFFQTQSAEFLIFAEQERAMILSELEEAYIHNKCITELLYRRRELAKSNAS